MYIYDTIYINAVMLMTNYGGCKDGDCVGALGDPVNVIICCYDFNFTSRRELLIHLFRANNGNNSLMFYIFKSSSKTRSR